LYVATVVFTATASSDLDPFSDVLEIHNLVICTEMALRVPPVPAAAVSGLWMASATQEAGRIAHRERFQTSSFVRTS